jgi:hypothetical protein
MTLLKWVNVQKLQAFWTWKNAAEIGMGGGGVANAISTVDGDITIFPSPQPLAKVDSLFPLEWRADDNRTHDFES